MTQPVLISCIISTIVENAVEASALYIMDKIKPVIICRVSVIPSKNPMFHIKEIEVGVGRSKRDDFIIFNIGFILDSCFFIKSLWMLLG